MDENTEFGSIAEFEDTGANFSPPKDRIGQPLGNKRTLNSPNEDNFIKKTKLNDNMMISNENEKEMLDTSLVLNKIMSKNMLLEDEFEKSFEDMRNESISDIDKDSVDTKEKDNDFEASKPRRGFRGKKTTPKQHTDTPKQMKETNKTNNKSKAEEKKINTSDTTINAKAAPTHFSTPGATNSSPN